MVLRRPSGRAVVSGFAIGCGAAPDPATSGVTSAGATGADDESLAE
jgi:hypothetical protein